MANLLFALFFSNKKCKKFVRVSLSFCGVVVMQRSGKCADDDTGEAKSDKGGNEEECTKIKRGKGTKLLSTAYDYTCSTPHNGERRVADSDGERTPRP